jgi:hypothetical protein
MRLRLRFSPEDSRVASFGLVLAAAAAVAAPQRVGTQHDALAVAGEHQRVTGGAGWRLPTRVERVEVGDGSLGELLHLALADLLSRPPLDRLDRAVERAGAAAIAASRRSPGECLSSGRLSTLPGGPMPTTTSSNSPCEFVAWLEHGEDVGAGAPRESKQ